MAAIPSTIHTNFTPPSSSSSCLRSFERLRSPFLAFTKRIGSKRACLLIEKADLAGRGGGARCWFKFGNSGVDAESAGIYGNQSREDFNRDDVEQGISYENMTVIVQNYVEELIRKYPYWNRTLGADHFLVTCHDVGVRAFEGISFLIKNSIRVVCSPSYNVDFIPHKDVALPQVLQPFALPSGGNDVINRLTILGFWAGHRNSKIRVILARVWENDTELAISNNRISRAVGELVYQKQFYMSKFCICPGGSQVNSARIADSIHYGCIPVILSDYYELPFNDVLNWQKFSLILKEKDVYELKSILKSVSDEHFIALHKGLVEVQKHFVWHSPPVPFDAFHMVMHELWLRHHVIKY